jgi:hypothetical protein
LYISYVVPFGDCIQQGLTTFQEGTNVKIPEIVWQYPELLPHLVGADHIDTKIVTGRQNLREFLAGFIAYQPGWITFLYRVRAVFVRLLGMKQGGIPHALRTTPDRVPMQPGANLSFFKIAAAQENHYWLAAVHDPHLSGSLLVLTESLPDGQSRFYVMTLVHYRRWTGPVYFNVIRPFHHIVVAKMSQAGVALGAV